MDLDLALAIAHHLLILLPAAALVAEWALLHGPVHGPAITRLARLDAIYGISALLAVAIGALRAMYGMKGPHYHLHDPWFWTKLGVFALIGLLSVQPALAFLRWRRRQRVQRAFAAPATERAPAASRAGDGTGAAGRSVRPGCGDGTLRYVLKAFG